MATSIEDLLIKIQVESAKASSDTAKMTSQLQKLSGTLDGIQGSSKNAERSLGGIGASALKIDSIINLASRGFQALGGFLEESVGAFQESQENIQHLGNTLAIVGETEIPKTIARFTEFADALQETTTAEDDQIIKLLDMGKVMGLTNDQAEQLVKASVDLAAVARKDVGSAFQDLSGTLKGNARSLAQIDPSLQNLGEEALKSGKAIEILGQRFEGAGAAAAETFSGAIQQAKNIIGNAMEDIGEIISVGFNLDAGANSFRDMAKKAAAYIKSIKVPVTLVVRNTVELFQFAAESVAGIWHGIVGGIETLLGRFLKGLGRALDKLNGMFNLGLYTDTLHGAADDLKEFGAIDLSKASNELTIQGLALTTEAELLQEMKDRADSLPQSFIKTGHAIQKIAEKTKEMKKGADEHKKAAESLASVLETIADKLRSSGHLSEAQKIVIEYDKQREALGKVAGELARLGDYEKNRGRIAEGFRMIAMAQEKDLAEVRRQAAEKAAEMADKEADRLAEIEQRARDTAKAAFEERTSALRDVASQIAAVGATQEQQLQLEFASRTGVLALKREELLQDAQHNQDAIAALDTHIDLELQLAEAKQKALVAADLSGVQGKNAALQMQLLQMGEDQVAVLEAQEAAALALIDADRKRLATDPKITAELDKQAKLTKKVFDAQKDAAKGSFIGKIGEGLAVAFAAGAAILSGFVNVISSLSSLDPKSFVSGIASAIPKAFENLANTITGLVDALPAAVGAIVEKVPAFVKQIVSALPALITQIVDALPQIVKTIVDALPSLITGILDGIAQLIESLPAILEPLFAKLPEIVSSIFDALPRIITALFDAIPKIIAGILKAIPGIIIGIVKALPAIIESLVNGIMDAIPEIAMAFIEAAIKEATTMEMARAIAEAVVGIFVSLFKSALRSLGKGAEMFKGLKDKMPEVKPSKALIDLPKKLETSIAVAAKKLTGASSNLFGVGDITAGVGGAAKEKGMAAAAEKLLDNAKKAAGAISEAGKSFYEKYLKKFVDALIKAWRWIWDKILEPFVMALRKVWLFIWENILKPAWEALKAVWLFVYDNVIKPMNDAIKAVWMFVYEKILKPSWELLRKIWDVAVSAFKASIRVLEVVWDVVLKALKPLWDLLKAVWDGVISALQGLWDGLKAVWDAVISQVTALWSALTSVWDAIKKNVLDPIVKAFSGAFDAIKKNVFDPIVTALSTAFDAIKKNIFDPIAKVLGGAFDAIKKNVFDPIVTAFSTAFDGIGNFFSSAFDGLKDLFDFDFSDMGAKISAAFDGVGEKISAPFKQFVNGFIDIVNKLVIPKTDVSGKVLGKEFSFTLLPKIDLVPGDIPHVAMGGIMQAAGAAKAVLPGNSMVNDKILAMLSEGEGIIDRERMSNPAVRAIYDAIMSDRFKGFYQGGEVGAPMLSSGMQLGGAAVGGPSGGGGMTVTFGDINITAAGGQIDKAFIRGKLMPVIKDELRRATLDGEGIIYKQGTR